jgi:hypothetical protein
LRQVTYFSKNNFLWNYIKRYNISWSGDKVQKVPNFGCGYAIIKINFIFFHDQI